MGTQVLNFDDIKESCTQLTALATAFSDTIDLAQSAIGKIVSPTWAGTAATAYKEKITTLVNNLPDAKQQLALSVLFLTSCANAYEELGEESINKLKELVGGQEYIDSYDLESAPTIDLSARYGVETETPSDGTEGTTTASYSTNNARRHNNSGSGNSSYSYTVGTAAAAAAATGTEGTEGSGTYTTITSLATTEQTGLETYIPSEVTQDAYGATGYDYWLTSGREVTWEDGTDQKKVSDIWKEQGSKFKNGIAVISVDAEDRYLVSVSSKYGKAGDCIDVKLADGNIIKCVIADTQDTPDEYGTTSDGKTCILNFQVERFKYVESGLPTTSTWNLEWDSTQSISSIKNKGSIIGAQTTTLQTDGSTQTSYTNTDTDTSTAVG